MNRDGFLSKYVTVRLYRGQARVNTAHPRFDPVEALKYLGNRIFAGGRFGNFAHALILGDRFAPSRNTGATCPHSFGRPLSWRL